VSIRAKHFAASALLALSLAAWAGAGDDQARIKAKLQTEKDPIKRAQLEIRLAQFRLDGAQKAYEEGVPDKGLAELKQMMALLQDAHSRMFKTGRNPRKKPKGFKEAEIKFREMTRRLKDLRLSIPVDDRDPLDSMIANIVKMQEHLLKGLMQVDEAKK
jgi:hypothetical protein